MRQKIIILKINKSGRRDERVGQKDDTFSIVGVPMGVARRGGFLQQQHEVGGLGGGGRRGLAFPTRGVGEGSWG